MCCRHGDGNFSEPHDQIGLDHHWPVSQTFENIEVSLSLNGNRTVTLSIPVLSPSSGSWIL
jgi:hypothetical protein